MAWICDGGDDKRASIWKFRRWYKDQKDDTRLMVYSELILVEFVFLPTTELRWRRGGATVTVVAAGEVVIRV